MPSVRLTKQNVATLPCPPGKSYVLFHDTELTGFALKVNAGGSRVYLALYRDKAGKPQRPTIGSVGVLTFDEARKEVRTLLAKVQTGGDPRLEKAQARAKAGVTLKSVTDDYLRIVKAKRKPRYYSEVERHLLKDWAPLAHMPLESIERANVATQLNALAKTKAVGATRARAALSALFTWAIGEGRAKDNPVIGTNKPAEEKSRERVLSPAELKAIWNACGDDDYGVMVRLLILTAQRRDEVGSMVEAELDEDGTLWTIPSARAKNGRTHEVPLSPLAAKILADKPRLADRTLVFGRGQKGFSGWSASKARMDARIKESGAVVGEWRLHDLRRTAATMMADKLQVQPHIIEAILNHVSGHRAGVAGVYNRATYRDEKRAALAKWSDFVQSIV